jgi:acetolactate synthase-1/2/3 large subunit
MPLENGAAPSAQIKERDMDRREFIDTLARAAAASAVTVPALAAAEEKSPAVVPPVTPVAAERGEKRVQYPGAMNGAQSLLKALVDAGITTCFGNPGTSEMHLVHEIGLTDKVRPVLCLQENIVTGAADGYGRMKGTPAFTLLHVGSGFANSIAMLHNAGRANTPIVNVVGANASYHQSNYPEHELINGRVVDLVHAVSHWSQEARSASELGELGVKAAALAKRGKICTVVAPTNHQWETANPPPALQAPTARPKASAEAIKHASQMLSSGKKTALVLGNLALRGEALEAAGRICAKSGAVLLGETFPSRLARGEGRPPIALVPYFYEICLNFLKPFEQLIFVGALLPVTTFAYKNKQALKSQVTCELFTMASVDQDLELALKSLAEQTESNSLRTPRQLLAKVAKPSGELNADTMGQTICMLMPENAILVDEAGTNGPRIFAATQGARAHDYLNQGNGGAIGGGLPLALGAAIACPDRKTILLQADGGGMYTVQTLWSMAREHADVVVVVLKNDAYAILELELARVREGETNAKMKSMFSLGNPSIDWVSVSAGLGVPATKAGTAEEFHQHFGDALAKKGPRLIECQVAYPNAWPTLVENIHRLR